MLPGGLPPPPPCRLSPDPAAPILRLRPTSGRSSNLAIVGSEGRVQGTRLSKATSLAWDQDGFACRWMHVALPPADGLMHAGVWSGLSFFYAGEQDWWLTGWELVRLGRQGVFAEDEKLTLHCSCAHMVSLCGNAPMKAVCMATMSRTIGTLQRWVTCSWDSQIVSTLLFFFAVCILDIMLFQRPGVIGIGKKESFAPLYC